MRLGVLPAVDPEWREKAPPSILNNGGYNRPILGRGRVGGWK